MLSPSGSSNYALVYDYKVNQWQQFNGFKTIFGDNYHQRGVYHNAQLYFATPESFFILCFDLENGYWEGSMTQLPSQLTFVLLMSSGSGNSICNNDFIPVCNESIYIIFSSVSFVERMSCEKFIQSIIWMRFESFAYLDINDFVWLSHFRTYAFGLKCLNLSNV
ncbi:hypothetical protein LguiB_030713 [Lonicera macranthoides]